MRTTARPSARRAFPRAGRPTGRRSPGPAARGPPAIRRRRTGCPRSDGSRGSVRVRVRGTPAHSRRRSGRAGYGRAGRVSCEGARGRCGQGCFPEAVGEDACRVGEEGAGESGGRLCGDLSGCDTDGEPLSDGRCQACGLFLGQHETRIDAAERGRRTRATMSAGRAPGPWRAGEQVPGGRGAGPRRVRSWCPTACRGRDHVGAPRSAGLRGDADEVQPISRPSARLSNRPCRSGCSSRPFHRPARTHPG